MMSLLRSSSAVAAALAVFANGSVTYAAPDAPLPLKPATPWHIDYAQDACILARAFGEGEDRVVLQMRRYGPGDDFRLILRGARLGKFEGKKSAKIRFGDALPEQTLEILPAESGTGIPAWIVQGSTRIQPYTESFLAARKKDPLRQLEPPAITAEDEALANRIHVGRPARGPFILETGPMREAFAALRRCTDEQLTHWGIDADRFRTQSVKLRPLDSPARWLTNDDFPSSAQESGRQSIVMFRLVVGTDGVPTACHIQDSHHPEDFNNVVCNAMMKRARFSPALDKDGQPMVSVYLNTVYFFIPN